MKRDLFCNYLTPTKSEFREENIIDDIYGLPRLIIPKDILIEEEVIALDTSRDRLVDNAIGNYNYECIMLKLFYSYALKNYKSYLAKEDSNSDFWCRGYIDQIIKEIYCIYERGLHIINYLYEFKVQNGLQFNNMVLRKLNEQDSNLYNEIKIISDGLHDERNNKLRNDLTHNFSPSFKTYIPEYYDENNYGWKLLSPYSLDELFEIINDCFDYLKQLKLLLLNKLKEVYPSSVARK